MKIIIMKYLILFNFVLFVSLEEDFNNNKFYDTNENYSNNIINDEPNQDSVKNNENESSDYPDSNTIPGEPGVDYPTYDKIPRTTFTCSGKVDSGYYADLETDCQVFHICQNGGHKDSFLCPNGSIFNQKYSVCDWWYSFDCDTTHEDFPVNFEIQRVTPTPEIYQDPQPPQQYDHYQTNQVLLYTHPQNEYTDLNIASSGGNNDPNEADKSTQRKKSNIIRETSGNDRTINPNSQRSAGESEKTTTTRNHVSARKVGKHRSDNNVRPLFQSGNHLDLTINEEKLNKSGVGNTTLVHPNVYPSGSNGFSNGRINLLKPVALLIPSQSDAYYQQSGDVRNINERESNNYP